MSKLSNHNLLLSTDGVGSIVTNVLNNENGRVLAPNQILFRDVNMSVTRAAGIVNVEHGLSPDVNGFKCFTYNGELLDVRRDRLNIDTDQTGDREWAASKPSEFSDDELEEFHKYWEPVSKPNDVNVMGGLCSGCNLTLPLTNVCDYC